MKVKITLLLFIVLSVMSLGIAQTRPINIALFNPVQIFPESNSIEGIRINLIYGKNAAVTGLDWGLVNHVGSGGFKGVQLGFINLVEGNVTGWQNGFINISKRNVEGFQWGWFNSGGHVSGFQLGLLNFADSMYGLQIGLLNFIHSGGLFPVFPIVNWSF